MLTNTAPARHATSSLSAQKVSLDKRLAMLFWPLLLILVGTVWLFPARWMTGATLLIGIGAILLGLNAVRLANGIPIRRLPVLLGTLAVVGGVAEIAGTSLPLVPLSLIAIGLSVGLELFPERR
jgi:Na+/phosphate symporter